jgi:hypothetical protein
MKEEGRNHAGPEVNRRLGRDPQVLSEPVFRVGVIALDQVQLIVAVVGQPAIQ